MFKNRLIFPFIIFLSLLVPSLLITPEVSAVTGNDWKAHRIIDDPIFFNGDGMGVNQIQSFLNAKVPTCDTNHAKSSSQNDSGPPYTCLKNYKQNTQAKSAESGLCSSLQAKNNSLAAQIIYDVGKACGVNQKALIVLLQKEQSLVTDTWPWNIQYKSATGFGCPDTAPCDSEYYGFFNQVYNAARQYKKYKLNPSSYNHRSGYTSQVRYHPNASCGSSAVGISNNATAGLYNYTPYQPNSAALNNLYGTGNSCSAYGNRNFWRIYNDWFGPTTGSPFFRIGNSNPIYVLGSENNYYHIPTTSVMKAYGYGAVTNSVASASSSHISGKSFSGELPLAARFEGSAIYLMDQGLRHHFTSPSSLNEHGFNIGEEAKLPSNYSSWFFDSDDMQEIVQEKGGNPIYSVESGKKRHFSSWQAYNTKGSPVYSSRPVVQLSNSYIGTLSFGSPILENNKIVKSSNTNSYGFWNGTGLQKINTNTISELGLTHDYVSSSIAIDQLPTGGASLNKLSKNSSGDLFMFDKKKKYKVLPGDLSELGLNGSDFTLASSGFLAKSPTDNMSKVIRINGSNAIYLIHDGGIISHFFNKEALTENGYSIGQAKSINTRSLSLFSFTSRKIFPSGTLYRFGNSSTVYLINNSSNSVKIPSPAIMSEYGLSFNSVLPLVESQARNYLFDGNLGYFVKDSSNNTWLVQSTGKRYPVSGTLLNNSHYSVLSSEIKLLSDKLLSKYSTQPALEELAQPIGSNKVYKIENGMKRWITSPTALTNNGYTWDDITLLTSSFLSNIPNGSNIN